MDVRTALGVEYKRREAEAAVEAALKSATEAEMAEASDVSAETKSTPKERFKALGSRIIALADETEVVESRGDYAGDLLHTSFTEIGVEGLAVVAKARLSYTQGSLRELDYLDVQWRSSAYVADTPFARQEVGVSEVNQHVFPEVYGKLRLMEQSVEVVELARQGSPVV